MTCPVCHEVPASFPHVHSLGVILNSRHYCPDGIRHAFAPARWWLLFKRDRCIRCRGWRP